uniref:Cytochrome P450 monooxygenase CYP52X1 n=1 Tax=Ganoderma boninense TaxID=34458 RepID=A0A5K1JZ76_9APHY|nr:Cytochrome P450 monooxygenase CYP52X1 [Ganoderma boninense]
MLAHITPDDVHVYESAPPSPRKRALALPPPSDSDGPVISLGTWKPTPQLRSKVVAPLVLPDADSGEREEVAGKMEGLEEGTPEDIRRRFFPTAPANVPSLEWMQREPEHEEAAEPPTPTIRFDLTGTPIPAHLTTSLPTHLGLHHHAEGSHAGYTLEDIFLLSRSTVPAQRASMLGLLAKIAHKLARTSVDKKKGVPELAGQELALRKRMLAAGAEAMGERASVGARAVELLWECTSEWDEDVKSIDGVELKDLDRGEALSSLPLDFVLPQCANAFSLGELPQESLSQLLAVLHRLAQHSNDNTTKIVKTEGLVSNVFQRFLLTPIPPTDDSPLPSPFALQFLRLLAASSRENASALVDPADSFLRFVITPPPSSPYPLPLATQLLSETLHFYATLASYGLYAHITTTAQVYFLELSKHILSAECRSSQLRNSWLRTLEAWTVCARDPHRTSPSHDILWSQVVGWGWVDDMLELRTRLSASDEETWGRLWSATATFLEGAKVNGVRGGEGERTIVLDTVKDRFTNGTEKDVVDAALKGARDALGKLSSGMRQGILPTDVPSLRELGRHADTLAAVVRLFLACIQDSPSNSSDAPPFILPIADLSSICAAITTHPLWASLYTPESIPYGHMFCRPLSTLLAFYLQLSRRIPGTPPDLWMAQAFAILCRLFPGDEAVAESTATAVAETITSDFLRSRGWAIPEEIWQRGGMDVIIPFLAYSLRPKAEQVVSPTWITPRSIATATTLRLPPLSALQLNDKRDYPLPLTKDWMFCPLDHLLKSGESGVFKALPDAWNASETEVVRATLLFVRVSQEVLRYHQLPSVLLSREEAVFGCMKVFMLEHDQPQPSAADGADEVFRDALVARFASELLAPLSAAASTATLRTPPPSLQPQSSSSFVTLDTVAQRLLGRGVPFFQWYTDLVALYDAVSFADPLFARVLLPPLSMRYPPDYRRVLWADFGHAVRTLRTPPGDVVTGSVAEYLWPVEGEPEVVGAYVRALVRGPLEGFVRLVAVHHVACNVWPDLSAGSTSGGSAAGSGGEKGRKLLRAVVDQGGVEAVRDVVLYRQNREGTILLPPACFEQPGSWRRAQRLEFAGGCGEGVRERLKGLLLDGEVVR